MNAEQTKTLKKALVLRVRADTEITYLHRSRRSLNLAIDRVEYFETRSDPAHKKEAWQRLYMTMAAVETARKSLTSP